MTKHRGSAAEQVDKWVSHLQNRVQVGHTIEIRCGEVGPTTGVDDGFSISYLLSKFSLHLRVTCELEKNPAKRGSTCFMTCEEDGPCWMRKSVNTSKKVHSRRSMTHRICAKSSSSVSFALASSEAFARTISARSKTILTGLVWRATRPTQ